MSTRNFPYWKIRAKSLGEPQKTTGSKEPRKVHGMDYNQNIVQHLAYNGCSKLRDEGTGELFNFSRKSHLLGSHVASPTGCSWSRDRADFANSVMAKGRKTRPKNARLGRSIVAACPNGLSPERFMNESIAYANFISSYFKTTVYVDFHDPKQRKDIKDAETLRKELVNPMKDGRNIHAHFFFPTYTVTPEGLGEKGKLRDLDLKTQSPKIIEELRAEWAHSMERGFKHQGDFETHIEHRSYKRQYIESIENGIEVAVREAQPKIGNAAHAMHKRGLETDRMKLFSEVEFQNKRHEKEFEAVQAEEKQLLDEIERLEALQNMPLPSHCIGTYTKDDHVRQKSYIGTHAFAQRTFDWLTKHHYGEPILAGLFEDFELLLDGPIPEEEKIPELPPEPTIGDLFEGIAMWIDFLQLRKRPRPHYARKWEQQHHQEQSRRSPTIAGLER